VGCETGQRAVLLEAAAVQQAIDPLADCQPPSRMLAGDAVWAAHLARELFAVAQLLQLRLPGHRVDYRGRFKVAPQFCRESDLRHCLVRSYSGIARRHHRLEWSMEILRNLARRKLRSSLTILGIVIGIFALTTMGALAEHFNALINGGVKYFGASIQVGPPHRQAAILPLSKLDELRQVEGVDAVFPSYGFLANPGAVNVVNFNLPDQIVGSDPGESRYDVLNVHTAKGRNLTSESRGEVVLGSTMAVEFKKSVGDTIDLPVRPKDAKPDFVNHTFTV